MKKKYLNAVLACITLLVWCLVLNELIDNPIPQQNIAVQPALKASTKTIDTNYSLAQSYKDPFRISIRKSIVLKKIKTPNHQVNKQIGKISKNLIRWPNLKYKGRITGVANRNEVALVEVEGRHLRLQKSDSIGGFKLSQITSDSLLLSNSTARKAYYR